MPRRANKWILIENSSGTWDLQKGGRLLYQGLANQQDAIRRMKPYYKPGEPVLHEEPDGYRTNITDKLKKSGTI